MNWVFLLISTSLSCHSARKACLELQNRHFKKLKKLLPGVRFPSGRLRVLGKVLFHGPQPTYATVPLSRRVRVICWNMDSATSPSAPRRMTGVGSILRRVKVLGIEKPTLQRDQTYQPKRDLVLCVWVFDWWWVHWLLIDSCVDYSTNAVQIVSFVAEHFNELDSSPILPPHSHVILHAGLARSCRIYISKS